MKVVIKKYFSFGSNFFSIFETSQRFFLLFTTFWLVHIAQCYRIVNFGIKVRQYFFFKDLLFFTINTFFRMYKASKMVVLKSLKFPKKRYRISVGNWLACITVLWMIWLAFLMSEQSLYSLHINNSNSIWIPLYKVRFISSWRKY